MAKVSISDALQVLVDAGLDLEAKGMGEAIKALTDNAFRARAIEIVGGNGENLPGKLVEKPASDAETWVTHMFSFAEEFANDFTGDTKKVQGGAVRTVRIVGIDTPQGHLKIELRSE